MLELFSDQILRYLDLGSEGHLRNEDLSPKEYDLKTSYLSHSIGNLFPAQYKQE